MHFLCKLGEVPPPPPRAHTHKNVAANNQTNTFLWVGGPASTNVRWPFDHPFNKQTGSTHTFTSIDWPIPWQWLFDSLPTDDFLQHICKVLLGVASRMRLQYPVLNEKDLKCMNFLHSLPHLEKIGPTSCVMISCSLYVICKTLYEIHKGLNIVWYVRVVEAR